MRRRQLDVGADHAVGRELEGSSGCAGRERREEEGRERPAARRSRRWRAAPSAMILRGCGLRSNRRLRRRRCPSPGRAPRACAARLRSAVRGVGWSHGRVLPVLRRRVCHSLPVRRVRGRRCLVCLFGVPAPLASRTGPGSGRSTDIRPLRRVRTRRASPTTEDGKRSQALIEPVAASTPSRVVTSRTIAISENRAR